MKEALRLLCMGLAVILFCLGSIIAFSMRHTVHNTIRSINLSLKDHELYQQYNTYLEEEIVTYSELISSLFYRTDYDLMIDDIRIDHTIHDVSQIKDYPIKDTDYRKSYQYSHDGKIVQIIYNSIR